jgi:glutathione S-transferase
MADTKPLRMISLKVSDLCELGRWLVERAGIPFYEEFHVPLLHVPATVMAGGGFEPPVLVRPGQAPWTAKTGMIEGVDAYGPPGRRVFGETDAERQKNQAFLAKIIDPLNPIGTFCYHFILPHKELIYPVASFGAPAWELWVLRWMYPVWRAAMGRALDGPPAAIVKAQASIESGLDIIDQELAARGTPFLAGDEPAGMDVVVAALLSPVVWPPQYGGKLPELEKTPQQLQDFVMKTRARPAGRLAMETYAKIRHVTPTSPPPSGATVAEVGG